MLIIGLYKPSEIDMISQLEYPKGDFLCYKPITFPSKEWSCHWKDIMLTVVS